MNRRSALKGILTGLTCLITPMAWAKKPVELLPESHPKPETLLMIDGVSARDSQCAETKLINVLIHNGRGCDMGKLHTEWHDGNIATMITAEGDKAVTMDGETHMCPFQEYERWALCGSVWYLASSRYVPEEYWGRPGIWEERISVRYSVGQVIGHCRA